MEELMLKIDNISKMYKLGQIGGTTLREEFQRLNARIRGKEAPTKKIGAKDYNKGETFMALDGVSFEVRKGERVGIIGHNGAGKSTLLKLISRVTAPTGGSISLNGRVASMLEVGTGFHQELTGRENIYMNGAILGMTKKEIDAKIEDIIEFSECRQFIDTPVKRYSSGMYVKLAFSVAAHLDSEIMIMDEVLAVGDMAFQKKCLGKMNDVSRSEGRTILYVSHNMNTIRQLCDRVIVLDHGRIVFDGEVEDGIDCYMNAFASENQTDIDLSKIQHYGDTEPYEIVMQRIQLVGKASAHYFDDENLVIKVRFTVNMPVSNTSLRLIVRSSSDNFIGTVWSAPISFAHTGTKTIQTEFPLIWLPKGLFRIGVGFTEIRSDGTFRSLDHVSRAITVEVSQKPETGKVIWQPNYWGSVRFPDIRLSIME